MFRLLKNKADFAEIRSEISDVVALRGLTEQPRLPSPVQRLRELAHKALPLFTQKRREPIIGRFDLDQKVWIDSALLTPRDQGVSRSNQRFPLVPILTLEGLLQGDGGEQQQLVIRRGFTLQLAFPRPRQVRASCYRAPSTSSASRT